MRPARWLVAIIGLCLPSAVVAQTVTAGAAFERYSFGTAEALDIESLTLFSAPFAATLQAGRSLSFRLSGAWARANLVHADGQEATLTGLTDTELNARLQTADGRAALTAIVLLPTGTESLTYEEMFVAGAIAADLLPFRVTNWGTGGGAGASLALATPFGPYSAGVSVGYVVAREYEPLSETQFDYRPGDQLHIRAAIDRIIGRTSKLAVKVDWRSYGEDQASGTNIFQTGDRLQIVGSFDFAIGRGTAIAYAGWLNRKKGEFSPPPDILPAQDLIFTGLGMRTAVGRSILVPSVDLRVFDSDGADRKGYMLGAGTALELDVGGNRIAPGARFRFGNVESADGPSSGFSGLDLGMTILFGGGRP